MANGPGRLMASRSTRAWRALPHAKRVGPSPVSPLASDTPCSSQRFGADARQGAAGDDVEARAACRERDRDAQPATDIARAARHHDRLAIAECAQAFGALRPLGGQLAARRGPVHAHRPVDERFGPGGAASKDDGAQPPARVRSDFDRYPGFDGGAHNAVAIGAHGHRACQHAIVGIEQGDIERAEIGPCNDERVEATMGLEHGGHARGGSRVGLHRHSPDFLPAATDQPSMGTDPLIQIRPPLDVRSVLAESTAGPHRLGHAVRESRRHRVHGDGHDAAPGGDPRRHVGARRMGRADE